MAIGNATLCTFQGTDTIDPCFSNSNATVQKIRQCDQDETPFMVLLLAVVVVFNLASLLATLRLNRIINYVELYKSSKSFLGFQAQPILHRAAVFQLVESDTKEDTELFDEIFQDGKDLSNFLNRPNTLGRAPLHNACERLSSQKCFQLINSGAIFLPDSEGKDPLWQSQYFALKSSERPEDIVLQSILFADTDWREIDGHTRRRHLENRSMLDLGLDANLKITSIKKWPLDSHRALWL